MVDVLEVAKNMSLGLRRWIHAAGLECQARSISHWSPYDPVGVVNAVP